MNEALIEQPKDSAQDKPGQDRRVSILGVPLGFGGSMEGVDIGPAAMRVARLNQRVAQLGYDVRDLGDLRVERPLQPAETGERLKYLKEISHACQSLCVEVKKVLQGGELPVILGGDHSIAMGSFAGAASHF